MKKLLLAVGSVILLAGCGESIDNTQQEKETVQEEKEIPKEKQNHQTEENSQSQHETDERSNDERLTLEAVYFNDIVEVDGKKVIQNPENMMVLVNKEFALPEGYAAKGFGTSKCFFFIRRSGC